MTEFNDVETALARYRPVAPGIDVTARIAATLALRPRIWSRPWTRVAAAVVLLSLSAAWFGIRYFNQSRVSQFPDTSPIPAEFAVAWKNKPRVQMPPLDIKGDVAVVGFNDWLCPGCLQLYVALEAVFADYEKTHPGVVVRILQDWPWSGACNPYVRAQGFGPHAGACEAAAAVRVARDHGRGDELVEWLNANLKSLQEGDAGGQIIRHTKVVLPGVDVESAMAAERPAIEHDVSVGQSLNVDQTPTYFINGVRLATVKAQEVDWAIRLELARVHKSQKP